MAPSNAVDIEMIRALVSTLLDQGTFPGQEALREQVSGIEYVGGPVTMVDFHVRRSCPAAPGVRRPVPNGMWVKGPDGIMVGSMLLWLDDEGYIACLEHGWVTDDPPAELPQPHELVPW